MQMTSNLNQRSEQAISARQRYRDDIDGVRAIAVISVLLFHANFSFFQGGFTGVDIFFVISGFLIGGHIIAEESAGGFTFASFYKRRAKRILPALFLVLTGTFFLGLVILSPAEMYRLSTEAVAALLSGSNFYYWHSGGYFAVDPNKRPLLMTWSLGVEEQFYLVVPLLIVLLLRWKKSLLSILASIALISFTLAVYQTAHIPEAAFYLLPARAWELLAGVVLAAIFECRDHHVQITKSVREGLGALGLCAVLLPIVLLNSGFAFPAPWALPSVLGTILLLITGDSWVNRALLSSPPMRSVGRISYSLYLWHWPLIALATVVLGDRPSHPVALVILCASFMLATMSYRFVEQPFRKSRTDARKLLTYYAIATCSMVLLFMAVHQSFGFKWRAPTLAQEEKTQIMPLKDACLVMDGSANPNQGLPCTEDSGRPAVVLWGDSHAAALAASLRDNAHRSGLDFLEIEKSACPPLEGTSRYFRATPEHATECLDFNDYAFRSIVSDPRVRIVVLTANWKASFFEPYTSSTGWIVASHSNQTSIPSQQETAQIFAVGLKKTIRGLVQAGKTVIILQDVPSFNREPIWRWRTSQILLRHWVVSQMQPSQTIDPGYDAGDYLDEDKAVRELISDATKSFGVSNFDLEAPFAVASTDFLYRDGIHILFNDNQHVSPAGATFALARFQFPDISNSK